MLAMTWELEKFHAFPVRYKDRESGHKKVKSPDDQGPRELAVVSMSSATTGFGS